MESRGASELCVSSNHDLTMSCSPTLIESTAQSLFHGHSCFEHIAASWSFVSAPSGLPNPTPPLTGACGSPIIDDRTAWVDFVAFVLDVSGSMALSSSALVQEVCGNGIDDDFDMATDEPECAASRMEILKDAAAMKLNLLVGADVRITIATFTDTASIPVPGTPLTASNKASIEMAIRGLVPLYTTGIGRGLKEAQDELNTIADSVKVAMLFTDGYNNVTPPDPITQVTAMASDEIAVDMVSVGGASTGWGLGRRRPLSHRIAGQQANWSMWLLVLTVVALLAGCTEQAGQQLLSIDQGVGDDAGLFDQGTRSDGDCNAGPLSVVDRVSFGLIPAGETPERAVAVADCALDRCGRFELQVSNTDAFDVAPSTFELCPSDFILLTVRALTSSPSTGMIVIVADDGVPVHSLVMEIR